MTVSLERKTPSKEAVRQFEPSDVSPRPILLVTLGLFLGMGLSVGLAFGILWWTTPRAPLPSAAVESRQVKAGPRLEVSPSADRRLLLLRAEQQLEGYRWVDRGAQTAHIPIDRAMAILASRGWPDGDDGERK